MAVCGSAPQRARTAAAAASALGDTRLVRAGGRPLQFWVEGEGRVVDGCVRYVTALGETDTAGGWRENKRNGGVLIDVPAGQVVARGLSMPHSPRTSGFDPADFALPSSGPRLLGDGEFNLVHDVAIDPEGRVYVADRTNERIQVFDADGKFLAKWDNIGAPWGLAYSARDKAIFMCDGKYNRILKLDLDGKVLGVIGKSGRNLKEFSRPSLIWFIPTQKSPSPSSTTTWTRP